MPAKLRCHVEMTLHKTKPTQLVCHHLPSLSCTMLLADGPCFMTKALCKGDTLCVLVALGLIDKILQVPHLKIPAGRQATASMKWRSSFADILMPLLRLLAR